MTTTRPHISLSLIGACCALLSGCRCDGSMLDNPRGPSATPTAHAAGVQDSPLGKSVGRIVETVLAGNAAYAKLERLCDDIGHRLSGSKALERAVRWALSTLEADGHENVHGERVMVERWVRGHESLVMLEPRRRPLVMLGLGGSVGTPERGITAPLAIVRDETELKRLGKRARGKIVLFNNPMPAFDEKRGTGYGRTVRFRVHGARLAAAQGAVAVLVRSVTARSLRNPHTGAMHYGDAKRKIPAAAVTTEDAELLARLAARGKRVSLRLRMAARNEGMVPSANVIAELRGREHPEEVVVIGGHLDSWDVGQGAHDDGAGCVMAMEALATLRRMKLRPRRTVRVVLWTNEENGLRGAKAYAEAHARELKNHVAAIEADNGGFRPLGLRIDHEDKKVLERAAARLGRVLKLLRPLGTLEVKPGRSAADVRPLRPSGVPVLGLRVDMAHYFDFHHSPADTLDKVDPRELSQSVAALAAVAYALAEMPERLDAR